VRKFYCRNPACATKIFSEQSGNEVVPYARNTLRTQRLLEKVLAETSSCKGAKLTKYLGISVSPSTALRILRAIPLENVGLITKLGIDDWAFRKGISYGTILVNMDTGKVVDILSGRDGKELKQWLRAHPEIESVCRDRSSAYAAAVREVIPAARQVADRFHLLRNLSDAVYEVIRSEPLITTPMPAVKLTPERPSDGSKEEIAQRGKGECSPQRKELFYKVKELREKGLCQKLMAALFDCSTDNISLRLKNIFKENELDENSVTEEFSVTESDGKAYNTKHYNLDAIIAIGYRVNSKRATAFRQWATSVLRDYAIRGYVIDKKRMENGTFLGEDYFEHLLAEIREIRLSERRFYQKITDIYATAMDYNKDAVATKEFFAKVQNKLHYAVHGYTAAEVIISRANAEKEHMGLTSWEKSPDGKVVRTDVAIAKNYLTETELESLGRIVNAYLDLAEDRAKRHIPMTMEDWAKRLDKFLEADDRDVLQNSGKATALMAKSFAESEFEKYRIVQDRLFESDFDKEIKQIKGKNEK